jgi:hypothetical protein
MTADPRRLFDDEGHVSDSLREMIGAARGDLPDAARIERLVARVVPLLGPAGTPGAAPAISPAGSAVIRTGRSLAGMGWWKVSATLVVVGATGAGVFVAKGRNETPRAVEATHLESSSAIVTPSSAMIAIPSSVPTTPMTATATAIPTATPIPTPIATPIPTPIPTAIPTPIPTAIPTPTATLPSTATEVELLDRAQDALSVDPEEALALTGRHAARFPNGSLTQEREVLAIEALVRLHRIDQARARANAFFRDFPSSGHRRRVEALLGDH